MTYRIIILHSLDPTRDKLIELNQFNCKPDDLNQHLHKSLNGFFEIVQPIFLPDDFWLLVDDEGLLKDLPYNPIASRLCDGWMVGKAIIMKGGLLHGDPDLVGLSMNDIDLLMPMLRTLQAGWRAGYHD